jgi:general L-amino acid transport system permease protein
LSWLFTTADWTLVTSRPQQYIIGIYPTEHAWRPLAGWLMVSVLFGLAGGMWRGAAERIAIGYGAVALVAGLVPYGMLHEGVNMPLDIRLLVLGNLPVLAVSFWLGTTETVGRPRWLVVGGLVAYALSLLLLVGLPGVMEPVSPRLWGGLMLNLILSVSGIVLSFPIGVALALGRRSNLPVVKLLCVMFIEVFRGVPLITLLFVSQVLVPLALPENFPVNSVTRAAIVITLFSSAYMAENIRGGLQGLPTGQAEAARALGLPGWQVTVLILLPQAVRNVIPAIVGQFIALFKDTSLVYIVGMLDILEIGRAVVQGNVEFADNGRELYIFVAVVFWLITYTMSYASRSLERHLGVGER